MVPAGWQNCVGLGTWRPGRVGGWRKWTQKKKTPIEIQTVSDAHANLMCGFVWKNIMRGFSDCSLYNLHTGQTDTVWLAKQLGAARWTTDRQFHTVLNERLGRTPVLIQIRTRAKKAKSRRPGFQSAWFRGYSCGIHRRTWWPMTVLFISFDRFT